MRGSGIAVLAAIALVAAPDARAAESDGSTPGPFGAIHPEAAARVMVGTALTPADRPPPGPGIAGGAVGGRAGASYRGLYGGLSFMYFGAEGSGTDAGYSGSSGSSSATSYGLELGYGRTFFGRLTVRGLLGVGDYAVTADEASTACTGTPYCSTSTTTYWHGRRDNFYLAPGALVEVALGPVLVGLDANLFYFPSAGLAGPATAQTATFASFMAGVQLGVRL